MAEVTTAMKYRLELALDDGTTLRTYGRRKRAMARKISALQWQKCHLEVLYFVNDRHISSNVGDYTDKASALIAWEAFNDPEVLQENRL